MADATSDVCAIAFEALAGAAAIAALTARELRIDEFAGNHESARQATDDHRQRRTVRLTGGDVVETGDDLSLEGRAPAQDVGDPSVLVVWCTDSSVST